MELLRWNVKQRFSEEKKGGFLHFHYHLFAPNDCCKLNRQDSGRDGFNIPQTGRNKFWTKMIFGEQPALSRWSQLVAGEGGEGSIEWEASIQRWCEGMSV